MQDFDYENLTPSAKQVYDSANRPGGVLRKFLSSDEIKLANRMVKSGWLIKGTSDDRQGLVTFFANYDI